MNEVQRYAAEFTQAIEENRILSSVFTGDLCCKIRIQLLPNVNY
jgi:membrane protein involved in colicin uptake